MEQVQVAVIDFAEFSREVADWVAHQSESLCARSALLAALEILHDRGECKFEAEYSDCLAAYPGAKFQCDELIGCVCAMDCDTSVFEETSQHFAHWKNKPVLCSDSAANVIHHGIVSAVVRGGQAQIRTCQACTTGVCCYKASPDGARNQHEVVDVAPLCRDHRHLLSNAARKRRCKRLA